MRRLYFLIFLSLIIVSAGAVFYFSRQFFDASEKSISANLQADLLGVQEKETTQIKNFIQEKPISLLFTGDIMLSRGVANQIKKHGDYKYPFLKIASTTQVADIVFGNLEGPISDSGKNQGSIYSFRADPRVAEGLKFAGFNILSLANNHILDWGPEALGETIDILKKNDIEWVGAGINKDEANLPLVIKINNTKIAFFSYTNLYPRSADAGISKAGISSFDLENVKKEISELKNSGDADIAVISFHWGGEYEKESNTKQKEIGHFLIDAGADLIVGHHPHIIQEIERYQDGWIAYSLGNFIFDQNFSEETNKGLMLKIIAKNRQISEIIPIEIRINETFQPEIASEIML